MRNLSDKELLQKVDETVVQEKRLTAQVLELLQEVENRKLYAELGYHSLFAYCTKHLKYSDASASVRVNATRLVKSMPEIKDKIDSGIINLTQASKIQSLFFQENIAPETREEIVKAVENKSTRETAEILDQYTITQKTQVKITVKGELLKKIRKIQSEFGGLSEVEVIESLVDKHIEEKGRERQKRESKKDSKNQRYITRVIKEAVDSRAQGRCEYVSPITGERCNCRTRLVYDHIRPIGFGGQSTVTNLRKVCSVHNQRLAINAFGLTFMEQRMDSRGRSRCNEQKRICLK